MSTTKSNSPAKTVVKSGSTHKAAAPRATKVKAPAPAAAKPPVVQAAAAVATPAPVSKPAPVKTKTVKAAEQRAKIARRASVLLKFVSDPTRLQVILYLAEAEHHVGALCEQLGQTQPAVSHHLALLRHGGIISPRRLGKNNFYSLSDTGTELAKVVRLLLQHA